MNSSIGAVASRGIGFAKATVHAWRTTLELRGLGSVSIKIRLTPHSSHRYSSPNIRRRVVTTAPFGRSGVRLDRMDSSLLFSMMAICK
jgi:hypothetical protein